MLRPEIEIRYKGHTDTPIDDRLAACFEFNYKGGVRRYALNVLFDLKAEDANYAGEAQGLLYQVNDIRQVNLAPKERNVYLYIQHTDLLGEQGFTQNMIDVFGVDPIPAPDVNSVPSRFDDLFQDSLLDIYNNQLSLFSWFPDEQVWRHEPILESSIQDVRWRVLRHPNRFTLGVDQAYNAVLYFNSIWRANQARQGLRVVHPDDVLEPRLWVFDDGAWVQTDVDVDAPRAIELDVDDRFIFEHGLAQIDDWNQYPELLDGVLDVLTEDVVNQLAQAYAYRESTQSEEIDVIQQRRQLLREEFRQFIRNRMEALREARRTLRPQFLGLLARPVIYPRPNYGRRRFRRS